jgi:signal transduction histidine kinase
MLTGPENSKLDKQQKDKLSLVNRHANRLLSMVNKLLDFSSIEGGRMSFKFRPCAIGSLTRDFAVLFRDAIERTKIEYVIDCDDDPSDALPVYLSPDVWEKITTNLISNALKYSVKGKITVTLRSTRGEAVLSVSDTGIGVPQAELGKIFDRFHRIEANSRMATGSGIGLALTLELVKLVGGQLECVLCFLYLFLDGGLTSLFLQGRVGSWQGFDLHRSTSTRTHPSPDRAGRPHARRPQRGADV